MRKGRGVGRAAARSAAQVSQGGGMAALGLGREIYFYFLFYFLKEMKRAQESCTVLIARAGRCAGLRCTLVAIPSSQLLTPPINFPTPLLLSPLSIPQIYSNLRFFSQIRGICSRSEFSNLTSFIYLIIYLRVDAYSNELMCLYLLH